MKKLNPKTSLLVSASAVAGLAMGASLALAAHPPIQLFTYEEVAAQMNGTHTAAQTAPFFNAQGQPIYPNAGPMTAQGVPNIPNAPMPVMIDPVSKQGMPYSPKQTCTGGGAAACHSTGNTANLKSYDDMSNKSFHSALGYNEWMDNSDSGLFIEGGKQTGLNPQKPWLQSHGHNGKW